MTRLPDVILLRLWWRRARTEGQSMEEHVTSFIDYLDKVMASAEREDGGIRKDDDWAFLGEYHRQRAVGVR